LQWQTRAVFQFMNENLEGFRKCFSREAAFHWFVITVVALMFARIIWGRFHSFGNWEYVQICTKLCSIPSGHVMGIGPSAPSVVRDRQRKSTGMSWRRMKHPDRGWSKAVQGSAPHAWGKEIIQESENSSKTAYIFGHVFGGLGIVIGNQAKRFCLPLSIRLQDGLQFLET